MSIIITNPDNENDVLFKFERKELPESIPGPGKSAKINKVEYNGGFQTTQSAGVYNDDIEWNGLLYGTYVIDGKKVIAKDRLESLKSLVGKIVKVIFPVPGQNQDGTLEVKNGDKGIYRIEYVKPTIKNHLNIEYNIKLVYHMRQEKVTPTETITIKPSINVAKAQAATKKIGTGNKPPLDKGKAAQAKNGDTLNQTQDSGTPKLRDELDRARQRGSNVRKSN